MSIILLTLSQENNNNGIGFQSPHERIWLSLSLVDTVMDYFISGLAGLCCKAASEQDPAASTDLHW